MAATGSATSSLQTAGAAATSATHSGSDQKIQELANAILGAVQSPTGYAEARAHSYELCRLLTERMYDGEITEASLGLELDGIINEIEKGPDGFPDATEKARSFYDLLKKVVVMARNGGREDYIPVFENIAARFYRINFNEVSADPEVNLVLGRIRRILADLTLYQRTMNKDLVPLGKELQEITKQLTKDHESSLLHAKNGDIKPQDRYFWFSLSLENEITQQAISQLYSKEDGKARFHNFYSDNEDAIKELAGAVAQGIRDKPMCIVRGVIMAAVMPPTIPFLVLSACCSDAGRAVMKIVASEVASKLFKGEISFDGLKNIMGDADKWYPEVWSMRLLFAGINTYEDYQRLVVPLLDDFSGKCEQQASSLVMMLKEFIDRDDLSVAWRSSICKRLAKLMVAFDPSKPRKNFIGKGQHDRTRMMAKYLVTWLCRQEKGDETYLNARCIEYCKRKLVESERILAIGGQKGEGVGYVQGTRERSEQSALSSVVAGEKDISCTVGKDSHGKPRVDRKGNPRLGKGSDSEGSNSADDLLNMKSRRKKSKAAATGLGRLKKSKRRTQSSGSSSA